MALWSRGIKDPDIIQRRYRCPECDNYSLHIKYESFAECENGCFITDSNQIDIIIGQEDFEGMFSKEELQYNFV